MISPLEQCHPRETSHVEKYCPGFGVDIGGFTSSFSFAAEITMARFMNFRDRIVKLRMQVIAIFLGIG